MPCCEESSGDEAEVKTFFMVNPELKTKVVHSQSKSAWNVVGTELARKYKIARVPYIAINNEEITAKNRIEAFEHALFISHCFNNSDLICDSILGHKI